MAALDVLCYQAENEGMVSVSVCRIKRGEAQMICENLIVKYSLLPDPCLVKTPTKQLHAFHRASGRPAAIQYEPSQALNSSWRQKCLTNTLNFVFVVGGWRVSKVKPSQALFMLLAMRR